MICHNCGGNIPDQATVCPLCGAAQFAAPIPNANAGSYEQPAPDCRQPYPAGYTPASAQPAYFEPSKAKTAQTLGIVGLCMQYFNLFPLVSLILCIAALVSAGESRNLSGGAYTPSAKVGRTCGILGIALAALKVFAAIVIFILVMVFFGSVTGLIANLPDIIEGFEEEFLRISPMLVF